MGFDDGGEPVQAAQDEPDVVGSGDSFLGEDHTCDGCNDANWTELWEDCDAMSSIFYD